MPRTRLGEGEEGGEELAFFEGDDAQEDEAGGVGDEAEDEAEDEVDLVAEDHGGEHNGRENERFCQQFAPLNPWHFLA